MKINWNNQYVRWGVTAFLVICGGILFYYLVFHTSNIKLAMGVTYRVLMPVFLGMILAYLLTPVLNWIENKILIPLGRKFKLQQSTGNRKRVRGLGILLTILLFYLIIQLILTMFISQIVPSIQSIVSNFDVYVDNTTNWINKILEDNPDIERYVTGMINRYSNELESFLNETVLPKSSELIRTISLSVIEFIKFLWNFIIGVIISIYLLINKEKFSSQAKKLAYALMEKDSANLLINNFRFTHNTFIGFVSGKVLDSLIIGLLCFIGTTLLQTPYAVLVSVIVGLTNIIPFFGPLLGMVPSAILVFVVDPMHPLNCVYFVIFVLVLQQVDGNIIGPKILGDSTGLSGFWVIFAITLFGGIWGIFGMIVGVPLFAIFYAAVKSYVNASLMRKRMPIDTDAYAHVECIDSDGMHIYEGDFSRTSNMVSSKRKKSSGNTEPTEVKYHSGMNFICSNDEWLYRYKGQGPLTKKTLRTLEETDDLPEPVQTENKQTDSQ